MEMEVGSISQLQALGNLASQKAIGMVEATHDFMLAIFFAQRADVDICVLKLAVNQYLGNRHSVQTGIAQFAQQ
jgi:hypothetical protein